jgi:uncharacterized protein (TIGR00299 family) protein
MSTASAKDTETVAWFHCFAGIAGDMALGSLVDAGADLGEVRLLLARLDLPGWDLQIDDALRGGVACVRAVVKGDDDVVVRTHAHIVDMITRAALPDRVTQRALSVFLRLAQVEGALHRRPVEQVHFHEVGGHDAVVDIVGTVAALEVLGVDVIAASAVATGSGMVRSAHGLLPNPSPAAVRLLEGIPTYGRDTRIELTTPTGAALLSALASSFGPMPAMEVTSSGFGGGAGEIDDLPNCTQVVIGRRWAGGNVGSGQPAWLLEVNLDDVTGEQLGYAVTSALETGAFDAWISSVTMKKGRPGHVLHVLTDDAHLDVMRHTVQAATGTFGLRATPVERWPSSRTMDQVTLDGMVVRMKVGAGRAKPEFDDVAAVASKTGATLHDVAARAHAAWMAAQDQAAPGTAGGDGSAPA